MKLKKPKFWDYQKPNLYSYLLLPFSTVFNLISKLKTKPKTKNLHIKTICVGNIYVGGTGKTSLAIRIKEILEKENIKACFIKKFYSGQVDEQKLLRKNGPLFTSIKRADALDEAIINSYEVAIFDDGLQDASIKYDLEIVCFNNLNWIGNGFTLPAGPLRESVDSLKFYNNVFLNGNEENLIDIKNKIIKINSKININQGKYVPLNIDDFDRSLNYFAFSGIGNHKTFINMLKNNNLKIIDDLEFPDHYQYLEKDFHQIIDYSKRKNARIITTEKDYLRLDFFDKTEILFIKSSLEIFDEKNIKKILMDLHEKV